MHAAVATWDALRILFIGTPFLPMFSGATRFAQSAAILPANLRFGIKKKLWCRRLPRISRRDNKPAETRQNNLARYNPIVKNRRGSRSMHRRTLSEIRVMTPRTLAIMASMRLFKKVLMPEGSA
jgi:hypothetical protein